MEIVINAVYYNPAMTLHLLEAKGWTSRFFNLWFGSMDSFSRVHDKKLSIAAIVSLLSLPPDQVPPSISVGWPRLLQVRFPSPFHLSLPLPPLHYQANERFHSRASPTFSAPCPSL